MKKIAILLSALLAVVSLSLTSCNKPEPEQPAFVGEYTITVVTDSVGVDGQMYSAAFYQQITGKTEPVRYGSLSISLTDDSYRVSFIYQAEGSSVVYDYTTTGHLNEAGQLVLDPCDATQGSANCHFENGPIDNAGQLVFRSVMSTVFAGMDCQYVMTVTASRLLPE